jgi:hypothetical protein
MTEVPLKRGEKGLQEPLQSLTTKSSRPSDATADAKLKSPAPAGILMSTKNKSALLFRSRAITLRTLLFMRGMVAL